MREEYDFSSARKNPYTQQPSKQVAVNVDVSVVDYFKSEAKKNGIPYQALINLYLKDCALNKRKFSPVCA